MDAMEADDPTNGQDISGSCAPHPAPNLILQKTPDEHSHTAVGCNGCMCTSPIIPLIPPRRRLEATDVSEAPVDISGTTVTVSTDISGSPAVDVSGSSVDVSGSSVDVSGSSVDVSGSSVDVSGSSVDVSGASVDVSGASIDVAKPSIWDERPRVTRPPIRVPTLSDSVRDMCSIF